ncbi:MAG: PAS domain-containing protein, partial [Desulfobacteraceae bacterium]|nr:PAS domain-containing protein [Desulfobacteraceae bacterium]
MEETNNLCVKTLSQIALIQSAAAGLPDLETILEFVCRGLESLPGVSKTSYRLPENTTINEDGFINNNLQSFNLKLNDSEFAAISLTISDTALYSPYIPYIKNMCHMLSVILEERHQRALKEAVNATLEELVRQRTREVETQTRERTKAEAALLKSEEQLSLALDAARDGFWDWNVETGEVIWSTRCYTMLGYQPNEFQTNINQWTEMMHPDDINQAKEKIQEALDKKNIHFQIEYRFIKKNGDWLWIIDRGKPVGWDANGRVRRMVGTHVNIDERKRAELALKENEERLNAILQTMPNALVVYDTKGLPQYLNPSFTHVFGWEFDELKGKRIPFVPEDQMKLTQAKIKEAFIFKKPVKFQTQRLTKAGKRLNVAINAKVFTPEPNTGTNDELSGLVVNLTDITERKSMEEQLSQAQKFEAIGTLAGGIAHDFNNILGIILGNTELAIEDTSQGNQIRYNLEEIKAASLRARDVVQQLLSFARKSDLKISTIIFEDIIQETLNLLRASIPKTIDIQIHLKNEATYVRADPTQIHQVLINLCSNASHAMEEQGGVLDVTLEQVLLDNDAASQYHGIRQGEYAQMTISDNGEGIEPEIMDKIFNPYFTTKDQGKGTGIGLAVVHGIVKQNKGAISVKSECKKGTAVKVLLPVSKGAHVEILKTKAALPLGSEKIMFIDDEVSLTTIGKNILEKLGYQVEISTDPIQALQLIIEDPTHFDLVITDMTMPGMTGDQLSQKLLKIREDMPIILCTGFSEKIDKEAA